jgi:hypothetical protein
VLYDSCTLGVQLSLFFTFRLKVETVISIPRCKLLLPDSSITKNLISRCKPAIFLAKDDDVLKKLNNKILFKYNSDNK